MNYLNKDYIEHLRRKYPPGTQLQLSCMEDEMAVPPGSIGTVDFIDDAGQIHMNWERHRIRADFGPDVAPCGAGINAPVFAAVQLERSSPENGMGTVVRCAGGPAQRLCDGTSVPQRYPD